MDEQKLVREESWENGRRTLRIYLQDVQGFSRWKQLRTFLPNYRALRQQGNGRREALRLAAECARRSRIVLTTVKRGLWMG